MSRLKDWADDDSWRAFFDIYGDLIYRHALKAGLTPSEAEDALQETILTVAKKIPQFKYDAKNGSFKGWLLNITSWKINDQRRKRVQQERNSLEMALEIDSLDTEGLPERPGGDLEKEWDAEWESNLLNATLQKVKRAADPQHYQIFDLYVLKGWPMKKVATALGVSSAQVYIIKHRLGALVKKELALLEQTLI